MDKAKKTKSCPCTMNKGLIIGILCILIIGIIGFLYRNKQDTMTSSQENQTISTNTPSQSSIIVPESVQQYLANANKEIDNESQVASGDKITVDYIGRLPNGQIFDTSIESIAKTTDRYSEEKDYTKGLQFVVGAKQMIKGFDAGVIGMKVGETKTINIPADEAYGQKNDQLIFKISREEAGGDISQFQTGMRLLLGGKMPATITEINEDFILIDANHELAGEDLIFDITVKSIDS